jgi:hypothetical protein
VVERRPRPRRCAVDEVDRARRAAGDADRDALDGLGGVERGERAVDGGLAARLEHAEDLARPVDVGAQRLGERLDLDAGERGRVGFGRVEDAVDEDEPQPVAVAEGRLGVRRDQGGGGGASATGRRGR